MKLLQAIDLFIQEIHSSPNYSVNTALNYGIDLRSFADFLRDFELEPPLCNCSDPHILDIKLSHIKQYRTFLATNKPKATTDPNELRCINIRKSTNGYSKSTIERRLRSLKVFYDYVIFEHRVDVANLVEATNQQWGRKRKSKTSVAPYRLQADELKELDNFVLNHSRPKLARRNQLIIGLMAGCGLRISEIVKLNTSQLAIKNDGNVITGKVIIIDGKGGKDRVVDMPHYLIRIYLSYVEEQMVQKKENRPLFISQLSGKRMTTNGIWRMVKKVAQELALTKLTPHKLRHTYASLLLENGVDIKTVSEMLGHEDIRTTEIYLHSASSSKSEAARSHPLNRF